ncbi:hypothetical protein V6N12_045827 [Hibiscus sabdariffa]|uniref:NB-ARC domain-containing protein n=1 Tax=Hibiscus sabdariffa TaxID=183260 RepID=A0ABR2G4D0_9ROSI
MGGIGKTTLVREVKRQVKEGKLFDSVVMVNVTQTPDVEKIQNEIADELDLEQSRAGKALRLRDRLKKEKNILVILDDIWAKLDIEEVGIPSGDEHKGCKLLLTSRDLNVLSDEMNTQQNFAVGILKEEEEEEAWGLFKKMAGNCVESSELQPTATEIAKKCGGLPIAIAIVARALKDKSPHAWKNALRELRTRSSSDSTGIAEVYSAIEGSYSYLNSEKVKQTFMLCCLIGHNGLIEELVRYTMGLNLFGGVNTMEEGRNKVLTVVDRLKASCLLLDSYNDERFDIHDIVWDAALNIATRDRQMLVLRDSDVPKEWSDKEKMKNCWAISLLEDITIIGELKKLEILNLAPSSIKALPKETAVQLSRLKLLDLRSCRNLEIIPPDVLSGLSSLEELYMDKSFAEWEDADVVGNERRNARIEPFASSNNFKCSYADELTPEWS